MKPVLYVLVSVLPICYVFGGDGYCMTSNMEYLDGTCILLKDCPELLSLVHMTIKDREYLKAWHCGFEREHPMVCCPNNKDTSIEPERSTSSTNPTTLSTTSSTTSTTSRPSTTSTSTTQHSIPKNSCTTRAGTSGVCVALKSCLKLAQMVKRATRKDLDYVQRSRCEGPNRYDVCCELEENNAIQPVTNRFSKCSEGDTLPDSSEGCCGTDTSDNRIIGGKPASISQYPWLVLIEYDPARPFLCGGSLISNYYVLTAAHCIVTPKNISRGALSVRLGEYNTANNGQDCVEVEGNGTDCTDGAISVQIASRIIHPSYNQEANVHQANDIALLKLQTKAPYTEFIRPICLPKSDITKSPPFDLRFVVAGWGTVTERQLFSNIKLHVDLPPVNEEKCRKTYTINKRSLIWDKQLCAGGELDKDSCSGDSGGPLMNLNDKFFEVVGIISFGLKQCGNMDKPSVYTKVYDYLDWIRTNAI